MDFFETHWCVLIILALQCYSSFFLLRVFLNLCPLGSRIFHLGCTFEWIRWLQYSLALFRCRVGLSASTWARRNSLSPCDQRLRHSGGVVSKPSAAAVGTAPSHSKQMNRCCLIFLLPIALRLIIASRSEARKGFTWRGRVYLQWKRWTLLTVVYAYKIKLLSSTFWASENIRYLEQSTGRKRREIEHCEVGSSGTIQSTRRTWRNG